MLFSLSPEREGAKLVIKLCYFWTLLLVCSLSPFTCHIQSLHFRVDFPLGNENSLIFRSGQVLSRFYCVHPPLAEHNWKLASEISRAIIFLCFIITFLCLIITSFILWWFGAMHTANNLPGSTFILINDSFASLQSFVTFPVVLDFGEKKIIIIYVN